MKTKAKILFLERFGEDHYNAKKIQVNCVQLKGEKRLCDCCDEEKRGISLFMLCGDSAMICKDCLKGMLKLFK